MKVEAASPTDRNETFPSTQAVWPGLRETSADSDLRLGGSKGLRAKACGIYTHTHTAVLT